MPITRVVVYYLHPLLEVNRPRPPLVYLIQYFPPLCIHKNNLTTYGRLISTEGKELKVDPSSRGSETQVFLTNPPSLFDKNALL